VSNAQNGRQRLTQNISLTPAYYRAILFLARKDAEESKQEVNVSAAIRKLVDARMRSEVGRDWESTLAPTGAQ
jgi:hypothetical protein